MTIIAVLLAAVPSSAQRHTLDECQRMAHDNYPLIKRYGMIERSTAANVSNAGKAWLPQVQASAQATLQSAVPQLPDMLGSILRQNGYDMEGLKKDQYRVGLDISQTLWDGGETGGRRTVARRQGDVQTAQTDVAMNEVRCTVNELYFGVLLADDRIRLNEDVQTLITSNLDKLEAMLRGGTAMECDVNALKAERLKIIQQSVELQSARRSLLTSLSMLCGESVTEVVRPSDALPMERNMRPELLLVDARLRLADAQEHLLTARLMPRLSIFAQGYYGYPGYDMFADMMRQDWSFNGMIGARLTWNIGGLYTRRNDRALIDLQRDQASNEREVFLFNNGIEQSRIREDIDKYGRLAKDDADIVSLRRQVRMATEAKLRGGIVDTDRLLQEITNENQAKIAASIHEIERLKLIYDLRYANGQ